MKESTMKAPIVTGLCAMAVIAGSVIGHQLMPRDLTPEPVPGHAVVVEPSDVPFAPSRAWLNAGPEQRAEAMTAAINAYDPEQTCARDVRFSYRGLFKDQPGKWYEMPSKLHPGEHHEFGPYVDGVCG